jgi:hypothetical protein
MAKGRGRRKAWELKKKSKIRDCWKREKEDKIDFFALPSPFCLFGKNVIGIGGK